VQIARPAKTRTGQRRISQNQPAQTPKHKPLIVARATDGLSFFSLSCRQVHALRCRRDGEGCSFVYADRMGKCRPSMLPQM
jgi:hypothetical protein